MRSESILYVVCDTRSRDAESDSRVDSRRDDQLIAAFDRFARDLLCVDERLLGVAHRLLPLVHLRECAVAAFGGLARAFRQLRQIELALLNRDLDLVHLIARLGDLGDGAHERLARIRQRLLVLADGVALFGAIALDLIGDFAEAIALRARGLELLRLLVE